MKRTLIIISIAIAILATLGGVAYTFGTPQAPDAPSAVASGAAPAGTPAAQPEAGSEADPGAPAGMPTGAAPGMPAVGEVAADQPVPEADPSTPLAIQIPGCRCHSDDPKIVEEHSKYRMNQCSGCHGSR